MGQQSMLAANWAAQGGRGAALLQALGCACWVFAAASRWCVPNGLSMAFFGSCDGVIVGVACSTGVGAGWCGVDGLQHWRRRWWCCAQWLVDTGLFPYMQAVIATLVPVCLSERGMHV